MIVADLTNDEVIKILEALRKVGYTRVDVMVGYYDLKKIKDNGVLPEDWEQDRILLERMLASAAKQWM